MNEKDSENTSKTDWARLATMSDEDIDTSDIPPLGDDFFADARLRAPEGKIPILLNLDEEIIDWYKRQGTDFQGLVNTALRDYAESHRH